MGMIVGRLDCFHCYLSIMFTWSVLLILGSYWELNRSREYVLDCMQVGCNCLSATRKDRQRDQELVEHSLEEAPRLHGNRPTNTRILVYLQRAKRETIHVPLHPPHGPVGEREAWSWSPAFEGVVALYSTKLRTNEFWLLPTHMELRSWGILSGYQ